MSTIKKFLIEGLDHTGKDTLIGGIQHRLGYHLALHYEKPRDLDYYLLNQRSNSSSAHRQYQEDSFRTMFALLRAQEAKIICNRAHLGECVYAPIYRHYPGEYVFELERDFQAHELTDTRLILLIEDFNVSRHFVDDGKSLGGKATPQRRRDEQERFLKAYEQSAIKDKRIICVTDQSTGAFKPQDLILTEALS